MNNKFLTTQIRIGIIFLILFISIGEFHGIPLRKYIYLPFLLIFIGTILKYKYEIFTKFSRLPLTLPLLIGIGLGLLSTVKSIDVNKSIKIFCLIVAGFIALYFLIINLLEKKEMEIFLSALLLGFLYIAIIGIYQYFYFFRVTRIYSTWGEPNGLGDYLAIVLPIFCGLSLSKQNDFRKILYISAFFIGCLLLFLTYSRSAWFAIAGSLVFLLIYKKKWLVLSFSMGFVILLFLLSTSFSERSQTIIDLNYPTNRDRLAVWKSTLRIIKDYPFTGIGIGTFQDIYPKYREPSAIQIRKNVKSCTNLYLRIPVEIGIFGIPLFLYIVVILFRKGFAFLRKRKDKFWSPLVEGMIASLISMLILGVFEG